jgi:hypothetical protein
MSVTHNCGSIHQTFKLSKPIKLVVARNAQVSIQTEKFARPGPGSQTPLIPMKSTPVKLQGENQRVAENES